MCLNNVLHLSPYFYFLSFRKGLCGDTVKVLVCREISKEELAFANILFCIFMH